MPALKGNRGNLYEAVADLFEYAEEVGFRDVEHDTCQMVAKGHSRIEVRRCRTITEPDFPEYVREFADWPGLQAVVRVQAERTVGTETTRKTRYYLTSLGNDAQQVLEAARGHRAIENRVHRALDVVFREDDCRIRKGNAPQNTAIMRHIALSLLQRDRTAKVGIKAERLKAAPDKDYLLKVLAG